MNTGQSSVVETALAMVCSSCRRLMIPHEHGVVFQCPNCGKVSIKRCKRCRSLSIPYTCPNCGFKGP
ncbi:MAG: zinc finger domain-containing protein [Desulfurococcaceae archaeon]